MKLILSTLLATGLATAAFAGNSDRYNDLRLDTSLQNAATIESQTQTSASKAKVSTKFVLSSRSARKTGDYPYINPYGIGPNNDSR